MVRSVGPSVIVVHSPSLVVFRYGLKDEKFHFYNNLNISVRTSNLALLDDDTVDIIDHTFN